MPDFVRASVLETLSESAAVVPPSHDVQDLTGRSARTFRDWAVDHLEAFQPQTTV